MLQQYTQVYVSKGLRMSRNLDEPWQSEALTKVAAPSVSSLASTWTSDFVCLAYMVHVAILSDEPKRRAKDCRVRLI